MCNINDMIGKLYISRQCTQLFHSDGRSLVLCADNILLVVGRGKSVYARDAGQLGLWVDVLFEKELFECPISALMILK